MRKRNNRVVFYLTDTEYEAFKKKVIRTSLSREGFIRKAIFDAEIHESPPAEVPYLLREYKRIGNNLNQVLIIANTKGFLDVPRLRSVMDELQKMDELVYKTYAGVKQ